MLQNRFVLLTFDKVHNPLRLPREATSKPPKVVRTPGAFTILTSKCASRHNGVHFFDISTSKSGPSMLWLECLVEAAAESFRGVCLWPECLVEAAARHFRGLKAGKRQA